MSFWKSLLNPGNLLAEAGGAGLMFANPALGAGVMLGGLKNAESQSEANKQRAAQAEITKYSPWTGMQGKYVQNPSLFGDVATGAAMGAMANGMMPNAAGGAGTNLAEAGASDAAANAATAGDVGMAKSMLSPQMNMQMPPSSWLPTFYSLPQNQQAQQNGGFHFTR